KFDEVGARFPATAVAADAMWEEASCYKSMGQAAKARELLLALKANAAYRDRVEQELAGDNNNPVQNQMAARGRAYAPPPPPPPARAAPPPPQAAPAQQQAMASAAPAEAPAARPKAAAKPSGSMGSSGKANAAPPKRAVDDAYGY